jgi:hypothetical protein
MYMVCMQAVPWKHISLHCVLVFVLTPLTATIIAFIAVGCDRGHMFCEFCENFQTKPNQQDGGGNHVVDSWHIRVLRSERKAWPYIILVSLFLSPTKSDIIRQISQKNYSRKARKYLRSRWEPWNRTTASGVQFVSICLVFFSVISNYHTFVFCLCISSFFSRTFCVAAKLRTRELVCFICSFSSKLKFQKAFSRFCTWILLVRDC